MKKILNHNWHLLTIPFFFVLHGFIENLGFISILDCLILITYYWSFAALITLICKLITKNWTAAAITASFILSFQLFFGYLQDTLKTYMPFAFLSSYRFLISIAIISVLIILFIGKNKEKQLKKAKDYLNILFAILILFDFTIGIKKQFIDKEKTFAITETKKEFQNKIKQIAYKPNIYLLVFDEYASSKSLYNKYGFLNNLDSFLLANNFKIMWNSKSNYNFTPFSIASLLNMSYVQGIKAKDSLTAKEYSAAAALIKENKVVSLLRDLDYTIENLSVFDLDGSPTLIEESFLPLKTKLITGRTFWGKFKKDFDWLFYDRFPFNIFNEKFYLKTKKNNQLIENKLLDAIPKTKTRPTFTYAHFYMPHAPFYFNQYGILKADSVILSELKSRPHSAYLEYVQFTNNKIMKIVNVIKTYDRDAIILIYGDHGFRPTEETNDKTIFANLNAIYLPNSLNHNFYDSISGVNEFRLLFNNIFNANFERLADSSVFLKDK